MARNSGRKEPKRLKGWGGYIDLERGKDEIIPGTVEYMDWSGELLGEEFNSPLFESEPYTASASIELTEEGRRRVEEDCRKLRELKEMLNGEK